MTYKKQIGFNFHIPTEIVFGEKSSLGLARHDLMRGKKCMVLKFPFFDREDVIKSFENSCEKVIVADEFQENPGASFAWEIGDRATKEDIDVIVAIGGGSTIDTAKAAKWRAYKAYGKKMGLAAVPTTAGTGSEVTPYAILTDSATNKKEILNDAMLFPDVAVCDPLLTHTMPKSVTANTGIDALSHAAEAYMSIKCGGFLKDLALSACRLVKENLEDALDDGSNAWARSNMMLASLQGGIVLARCGTVLVHAIGYGLTHEFGYPHGYSNGLLLAAFLERMAQKKSREAEDILGIFGGDLRGFVEKCGIPQKIASEGLDESVISGWVDSAYNSYGRPNSRIEITREDIEYIISKIL